MLKTQICVTRPQCVNKLVFVRRILVKIPQQEISRKFVRWEPRRSVWTDERTGIRKLAVSLRNCSANPQRKVFGMSACNGYEWKKNKMSAVYESGRYALSRYCIVKVCQKNFIERPQIAALLLNQV